MPTYYDEFYGEDEFQENMKKHKHKTEQPVKKKAPRKAKHKHDYAPCLLHCAYAPNQLFYTAGKECKICKKLTRGWDKKTQAEFQKFSKKYEDDYSVDLMVEFGKEKNLPKVKLEPQAGYELTTRTLTTNN